MTSRAPRVEAALRGAARRLARCGCDSPRRAARVLLHHATGIDRTRQLAAPDARLDAAACARFAALVRRRAAREPLAYITGTREFRSLDFAVTPAALIPRPDSETTVEAALARASQRPRRVLDLGTGSGCLLLALLGEWPSAFGVGVDRRPDTVALAASNAHALGMAGRCAFVAADWGGAIDGRFDVIVCNPPYVASGEMDGLAPELAYEPRLALDGGADGLASYRAVTADAARLLDPGGIAAFEIGAGQEDAVRTLMRAAGLRDIAAHRDLSGTVRCLSAGRS